MTGTLSKFRRDHCGECARDYCWVHRFPEKLKQSVVMALGIFTLLFAIQLFLKTENAIIPLLSILGGVVIGEWLDIESRLAVLAHRLVEKRFCHQQLKMMRIKVISSVDLCQHR